MPLGCSGEQDSTEEDARRSVFLYSEPSKQIQELVWEFERVVNEDISKIFELLEGDIRGNLDEELLIENVHKLNISEFSATLLSLTFGQNRGYGVVRVSFVSQGRKVNKFGVIFFKERNQKWRFSNLPFFSPEIPEWGGSMIDW